MPVPTDETLNELRHKGVFYARIYLVEEDPLGTMM